MVLGNYMLRSMRLRWGRTLLTLASIVIGVAGLVGVSISSATSRAALTTMFATVSGNAALEVSSEAAAGFDIGLVEKIEAKQIPGVRVVAPLLRRTALLDLGLRENLGDPQGRVGMIALGIDPEKDKQIRDFEQIEGVPLVNDAYVHLEEGFAHDLNLKVGDVVRLVGGKGLTDVEVTGILRAKTGSALRQQGFVFLALEFAQEVFQADGQVDAIQIVTKDNANVDEIKKEIAALLPEGLKVARPGFDAQSMQETLLSFEMATTMSSGFTLLLAAFIILNTFFMNVGERRKQLAVMRAIGATRNQLFAALILESIFLGAIGSILGLGLGILLARGLVVAQSSFLGFTLPDWKWQPIVLVWSVGFGVGISIVGSIVPAWRAGQLTPLEGMRGSIQQDLDRYSKRYMAIGFVLVIVNFLLIFGVLRGALPEWVNDFAGTGMLLGLVLSIPPLILGPLSVLFGKLLRPIFRVAADLAERQVLRHRTRSALTTGVLFIAGATGVGMALSILDTVTNVRQWYDKAIQGDFFIRAMLPRMDTNDAPNLPDSVGEALAKIPEIDEYDPIKFTPAYAGTTKMSVISRRFERKQLPFDIAEVPKGKREDIWEAMQAGDIVVGSVLAQRMNLHAGGDLELNTTHGKQKFHIAAVVNDYFGGGLTVYMPRHLAEKHFDISGSDGFAIFVSPEDRDEVEKKLETICRENGVMLLSQKEIKSTIDGMVNTLDGCLWVLLVLGFVVSAFGVVNTLTMNVLEQTRELGMLRIVAMTRAQVRKTILMQALIIGMIGIAPGVLAGVGVAILINYAMTPALGHAVSFHFHPIFLVFVWLGALAIVLIAAMIPAERAARIDVVDALHYE